MVLKLQMVTVFFIFLYRHGVQLGGDNMATEVRVSSEFIEKAKVKAKADK